MGILDLYTIPVLFLCFPLYDEWNGRVVNAQLIEKLHSHSRRTQIHTHCDEKKGKTRSKDSIQKAI